MRKKTISPHVWAYLAALPEDGPQGRRRNFYDLGYSDIANGASEWPYYQQKLVFSTSFPLSAANAAPPPFATSPPVTSLAVIDPNHVLPRTYEWNAAIEKSLGGADVITLTYLGAAGRKLMRQDICNAPNGTFTGEFDVMSNDATSNYNSLQAQFRHRFSHGLQTLLSYTWAHSIDASSDAYYLNVPPGESPPSAERASSDYDIRQTFSGAVSYNAPAPGGGFWKAMFGNHYSGNLHKCWDRQSVVSNRRPAIDPTGAEADLLNNACPRIPHDPTCSKITALCVHTGQSHPPRSFGLGRLPTPVGPTCPVPPASSRSITSSHVSGVIR
jgi:hypothetical protein